MKHGLVLRGLNPDQATRVLRAKASPQSAEDGSAQRQPLALEDQKAPARWHKDLMRQAGSRALKVLRSERGLSRETIERYNLGWDGDRITIPVRQNDRWVNVRRYRAGTANKMLNTPGHGVSVLYPEDVVLGNDLPVLFCEGELDALLANQESEGLFVAATGTGGSSQPPQNLELLGGRDVFVAYDADEAGRSGAQKVVVRLRAAGARVFIIDLVQEGLLPAGQVGADISDFFLYHDGSAAALYGAMREARQRNTDASGQSAGRLVLRPASAVSSRRQRFLWDNRIPLGAVTLFAGRGGVGKSTFALWLAAQVQHGTLPGDLLGQRTSVLYVSVEDDWATQMKPRLAAAGADMDRIFDVAISTGVEETSGERYPSLPDDLPLVKGAIEATGARLVIFDPITSSMTGNDHHREVVRSVLDPLAKLAREMDVVVIGIMHFNKGGGNASDKLSGSHAYRDAARAVMLFAKDDDQQQVVMTQDKGNYADFGEMSIAYRLEDTLVPLDDGDHAHAARVEYLGETLTTVDQLINRTPEGNDAVMWLQEFMRENSGTAPASEAEAAGEAEGYKKSTLTRARRKTRPPVESRKSSLTGGWEWYWPEGTTNTSTFRVVNSS
ncbi:AAA family ATPase [Curtobacterium sp. MCSS17_005]|uniref:AAA family ATPase n=1 Tax=Curtobacterium sp. MCSS17_005 TaxID=2175641 RepID=UPI0024DF7E8D|nr:AAA family ATPase [Curtobacterium sp. MCSS17_005]WIB33923.1 AAA family ATPase [Curtobacterium sp. MCSS17_005]